VLALVDWLRCSIEDFQFERSLKRAKNSDEFLIILLGVSEYFGSVVASNYDVHYVYNSRRLKIPKRHIEKALLFLSLYGSDDVKQSSQVLLFSLASFVPMPMSEEKKLISPTIDADNTPDNETAVSEFMRQLKLVDANASYAKKFEE
jgi:archaellum biogenesis ATPase FlaH